MGPSRDPGLNEVEEYLNKSRDLSQYDPHQSEEDRRKLRKKYRALTENMLGTILLPKIKVASS
jgi:hypothetical protein